MAIPPPPTAGGASDNILEPVAWMLMMIKDALNEAPAGRAPRWVRIARGRRFTASASVGPLISGATQILIDFVGAMHWLLLDLEELLLHIDPEKALVELLVEMAKAATAPELGTALATLLEDPDLITHFADAQSTVSTPDKYLQFIPEPSDIRTIGHQLYGMINIGPWKQDGTVDPLTTGRIRLLSWSFNRSFGLRLRPLKGSSVNQRVARLGIRARTRSSESEPALIAAHWPPGDPRGEEIYAIDVAKDEDLAEVVSILDALGYPRAIINPDPFVVDISLAARLLVFQHLNDLPDSGELDRHTLHRLLNLDFAGQNIARARPFDPARWRKIPPPPPPDTELHLKVVIEGVIVYVPTQEQVSQGEVKLVNPGADDYADEKLALGKPSGSRVGKDQKKNDPRRYYRCGSPVDDGAVFARFPNGVSQGWIRHRNDDDRLLSDFKSVQLDCHFVGMESRPPPPKGKGFEGGVLSEGASLNGNFFFSAREVEPWMSGRKGTPVKPLFPAGARKWPRGSLSGMYQWADITPILPKSDPPKERLYIQAMCARRSLYKERGDGFLPDQGMMVLGLVPQNKFKGDKPLATRYRNDLLGAWAWSGWWPDLVQENLEGSTSLLDRGQGWVRVGTPPLLVTSRYAAIFIGLYGKHNANLDTDAYFDDVKVIWWQERFREGEPISEGNSDSTATSGSDSDDFPDPTIES